MYEVRKVLFKVLASIYEVRKGNMKRKSNTSTHLLSLQHYARKVCLSRSKNIKRIFNIVMVLQ